MCERARTAKKMMGDYASDVWQGTPIVGVARAAVRQ